MFAPAVASAHEVYVLPPDVIQKAIATPAFSEWNVILTNVDQFLLWALIGASVVLFVFFVSVSRSLENLLDPFLAKLPPYAPAVSRITVGLSFMAAAYYGALFGPELPLAATFGSGADAVRVALVVIGFMITVGFYPRIATLGALALFAFETFVHGTYMFTYANYLGEIIILMILGAHVFAMHDKELDKAQAPQWFTRVKHALMPYSFLILRIAFGVSLIYASLYAKIIHNQLALAVAQAYPDVVHFFGFEPHFLVLGAGLVEVLLGTFFILGIEIRFTSAFLLFWLSLSLWYFGEVVWPHVILIGIPIAFILYGYDKTSLEGRFFKREGREPVL